MFLILIIAVLGIAFALPQASYGSESFAYWGCGSVNPSGFGEPIRLPPGQLNPDVCKSSCTGYLFAAVSPDACRCGDDPKAIIALDEKKCDNPCNMDPNSPICGGLCPDEPPEISNVFIISPVVIPLPVSESVSTSSTIGSIPQSLETAIPETTVTSILQSSATSIPVPPPSSVEVTSVMPITTSPSLLGPSSHSPSVVPNSAPSVDSTIPQASLSNPPLTVPNSDSSDQSMPEETTLPELSSLTTLWTEPSITPIPGDPPLPSQITTSSSNQIEFRFFTAFWEVLVMVALIL
ncbi:hypothetical protein BGZ63DRAFT_450294 [Mariannaea sp. PMI_226]|nr:hypothetical protein BGZ63DRAFT_450294 [Mariannaea sp. PMI_226]